MEEKNNPASGLHPAKVILLPEKEYLPESRQWQGIPGIECAPNGRLWATWYTGTDGEGPGNVVVLATKDDERSTWKDPVLIIDPGAKRRAFDPCLWHDPKGYLWLFWAQCGENEYYDGRAGVWAICTKNSNGEQPIWTDPVRLCHGIMMNKPTLISNGDWLLPVAVWFENCIPPVKKDVEKYCGSGVVSSSNDGKTWNWRGAVCEVPCRSFDEHMLVERNDGSIWMLVRTKYGIAQSESYDSGYTWTRARATEIENPNSRFFVRRLNSGALLLVKHHGFEGAFSLGKRSHLTALISDDDGQSWQGGLLLEEREGVSYPDGIQVADGVIHIIYDFNRGDRWAGADDREILMATFKEEDVRAGKFISEQANLKQIVSKVPSGLNITTKTKSGWQPKPAKI